MKVKQELSIQTKDKLIQKILSLRSYCGKLKNLLTEYKATILLQQRQIVLQGKKLDFWENTHGKRTYSYIGSRHNRDIGTLKRASLKRSNLKHEDSSS